MADARATDGRTGVPVGVRRRSSGGPNVGKSTLVNRLVGRKVSIVSDRPQTTRTQIRGVRTTSTTQIVFLDTPGIHKPAHAARRAHQRAARSTTLGEVDVVCFVVEANAPIGPGDRFVAELVARVGTPVVLVVNKVDVASPDDVAEHLADASAELGEFAAFVPLSARDRRGRRRAGRRARGPDARGAALLPRRRVSDQPEAFLAAELLREKLLAIARDELPHSIAVTTEEFEERETATGRCSRSALVVRVERDSQRGIVIGTRRRGAQAGRHRGPPRARSAARHACAPRDPRARSIPTGSAAPSRSTASGL